MYTLHWRATRRQWSGGRQCECESEREKRVSGTPKGRVLALSHMRCHPRGGPFSYTVLKQAISNHFYMVHFFVEFKKKESLGDNFFMSFLGIRNSENIISFLHL